MTAYGLSHFTNHAKHKFAELRSKEPGTTVT
jgi:hypothetical protein